MNQKYRVKFTEEQCAKIAERVFALRNAYLIDRNELAAEMGVSSATIQKMETGGGANYSTVRKFLEVEERFSRRKMRRKTNSVLRGETVWPSAV